MVSSFLRRTGRTALTGLVLAVVMSSPAAASPAARASTDPVHAVGAEAQYANVIAQIGGPYVAVTAVMVNPSTDPHSFEMSAAYAAKVAEAQLVVQNGLGYDGFMNALESASPNGGRHVIVARRLLGYGASAFDPHLWYDPRTMPLVARAVASALEALRPSHAAYFRSSLARFDHSLAPWRSAIAAFRLAHPHRRVAVSEPVADHLLRAMGLTIATPDIFQSDVMNGLDPAPQAIALQQHLLTTRSVAVFCYNEQVMDALTASLYGLARTSHVPIVGVSEIMPPTESYQAWMLATTNQLAKAVARA